MKIEVNVIKHLRAEVGITQVGLALALGIPRYRLQDHEQGVKSLSKAESLAAKAFLKKHSRGFKSEKQTIVKLSTQVQQQREVLRLFVDNFSEKNGAISLENIPRIYKRALELLKDQ